MSRSLCDALDFRGFLVLVMARLVMGAPLGADHPPGGCSQQFQPVVKYDRPLAVALPGWLGDRHGGGVARRRRRIGDN